MDTGSTLPIMKAPTPEWLTRQEAADLLRVSVKTIDRRLADGTLKGRKVGRSVRVSRASLLGEDTDDAEGIAA